ncbi:hypothetical protein LBMAG18_09920 [Alphaproteobacteria bacterium]|nr:hypothetical protein LBMAG18_09920 [Alphaproteobacteria bacterium]
MINFKGLKKLFVLLLLASQIFSCDTTCVEADEFSIIPINLDSNMRNMKVGVFGSYNHNDGGQSSDWYDTGIRTNGSKITLTLVGGWIYSGGSLSSTQEDVDKVKLCKYCSKDIADPNPTQNCICHNYDSDKPDPELKKDGTKETCSAGDQTNPEKCTCFDRGLDSVTKYGVYHQSRNSLEKTSDIQRKPLKGQDQSNCRMARGMGAYISLWGVNGAQTPNRAYHLYTHREYCPVPRGPNGECEKNGVNVLRYIYESPNNTIFIKDDGAGNILPTVSTSVPGFQYHGPNEVVKLIIYDGFYDDNAGKYSIYFVGGFGSEKTNFILEFITGLFEDVLLGARNSEGQRVGGILEFFYNSVVNNPPFQMTVQFMLVLYIVFFGGSYLMGVVDITRKELSMIIMKIALIVMFTNPLSWGMYKSFIVNFFKDGMDQLMAMIMMSTDTATGESSNLNYIAQGGRAIDGSNATRFSYPDLIMKKLLSPAVAKKLLGVIGDGNIYGIIYFFVTYALIFYFIYVMLLICSIYLISFLKLILLLGLGPIFISLALFSKTNQMFKSWLSFLGSRALEMAILFLVLSPFLMLIDRYFTELFYFRVCGVSKGIPPVSLIILQTTELDRSLFEWLLMFLKIATVIFIMQTILDRVPQISGQLISIGGIPNQDTSSKIGYGASGFGLAMNAANAAIFGTLGAIKEAANFSLNKSGIVPAVIGGATAIARKTGIASAWNAIGKKIPFRGPRTRMRDMVIEGAIKEARAQGIDNGLSGKELDKFIRDTAMDNLARRIAEDPNKMAMLGVDAKNISKVMDRVLVRDGLKDFLKDRAQELKSEGLVGKEMRQKLREDAREWAKNNLYDTGGLNKVDNYLKDRSIRSFLRGNAEYSSSEAAKIFTTPQERAKFLLHLEDLKHRNQKKWENAKKNPITHMFPYLLSRAKHEIIGDPKGNPNLLRKNFDRKAFIEENGRPTWGRYLNPISHINFLDRRFNKDKFEETKQFHDELLRDQLREKIAQDEEGIGEVKATDKKAVRKQKNKKISQRDMMKNKLRELAVADIEKQLNKEPDYEDYSKSFSFPGSYERKEQLQEKLLRDIFEDDGSGRNLFEKAVQYDYLSDKEYGKPSMEQLIAQASFNDLKEFSTNIDSMSLDDVLKVRENITKNVAGKGFSAIKLDATKHGKLIQDGISGNFEIENLFGSKSNPTQDESSTGNHISKDYENKVKEELESIDKKILDKIMEQTDLYQEEIDRLDENFDQLLENSKSANKRKVIQRKYADRLRDFANQLESSLGGDINQSDNDLIYSFKTQADTLDKSDSVLFSPLPKFDNSFIAKKTNLDPQKIDDIKKVIEDLEKDRSLMQANIDESPIVPVNFPEISPKAMSIESENVARSSNDVDYKLKYMLAKIALFKGQNSIRFDSGDFAINQRNIEVLNQEFDKTRLSDSSYILPQLDKNIGALRSLDNTYLGISTDARGALGVDKSIEFNLKLNDDMAVLKSDIEKGKVISQDEMKAKIEEISRDRVKAINFYDKATTIFKVEDILQKTRSENFQQKTGLATKNLENILIDFEVRDSLIRLGLGDERYQELRDADEKVKDVKQNLSRPSIFSQIPKDLDQDGSSFKELSIAKIESIKDQTNQLKNLVNVIDDNVLDSSLFLNPDLKESKQELLNNQERLQNLYALAQEQINKGSSIQDVDNAIKEIRKAHDDFVFESKFFTQEVLSDINKNLNSGDKIPPELRRDLLTLSDQLKKIESQTEVLDKAKLSESAIDLVETKRPSIFSQIPKDLDQGSQIPRDLDQDGSSFKELSIAKIESIKDQTNQLKNLVNVIDDNVLDSSLFLNPDLKESKQELLNNQERLQNLYALAQEQINKGSSIQDVDNAIKEIRKAHDDFVFESKFFTQEVLSDINKNLNSGDKISPESSRDLLTLSDQLKKIESQTEVLDKAKLSESAIDLVAPNRYEIFEKYKDKILQEVVNDKIKIDDLQQSLQKIPNVSKDEKITALISDISDISKSQNDAVKEIQQLVEQPSNQNRKSQIDDLVFKLDNLNNSQRKLVNEYVRNNSANPDLLESIDRFKLFQEFLNSQKTSQLKSRSEEIKTVGLASNFESIQQSSIDHFEDRHQKLVGITKALISTKISDALINSNITNVFLGGSIKNAFLGGGGSGLPMIGGGYLGDNSNKEALPNASELEAQKKLTALSSKMDKLNIKIISLQLSKIEEKKSLSSSDKIAMVDMNTKLSELKSSLSKKQNKITEINKILFPSD